MCYAGEYTLAIALSPSSNISLLPRSKCCTVQDPNWLAAMRRELTALLGNLTWELVPPPPHANIIIGKWVSATKLTLMSPLRAIKPRRVVCSFRKRPNGDCGRLFPPVVSLLQFSGCSPPRASRGWLVNQLDLKNTCLHYTLNKEVFCFQQVGIVDAPNRNTSVA